MIVIDKMIHLTIDNIEINVPEGTTILEAARSAGIYIPVLCSHPDLKPFQSIEISDFIYQGEQKIENDPGATIDTVKGCGICVVWDETNSKPMPSCKTPVAEAMNISTDSEPVRKRRQENLSKILAIHPHSCLTCSQREGCIPLTDVCPGNVVFNERCCALLGNCEIQKIVDYVGILPETPRYRFGNLPRIKNDPFFNRDYNLCISCGRCVRVCQQVKGVYALGAVIKNGRLVIGTVNGPSLNEAECRFCGSCVEVCPTGALMDKRSPRIKEFKDLIPCRDACPGEVDIPQYVRLVNKGKTQEAAEVIAESLPLPSVLGKVCFHPCETACKRNEISEYLNNRREAMSVRKLKDFAMTHSVLPPPKKLKENTGKKVAVIGSGPAGLTAAHFLALKGHDVTIYEKESKPGGMLRYGIPRYRLSENVLDKDINWILSSGIKVVTDTTFGKDVTLESLKGIFDAVFIGTGLSMSRKLPATVEENDSIAYGVEFLNSLAKDNIPDDYYKSKSVIIIGGGNVATDAARCATRLKAENVTIVCLAQYDEMPAYKDEIKESEEEGIKIKTGWGISYIKTTGSGKNEIGLKKCASVFDSLGKFSPSYDETATDTISADNVIICIGQQSGVEIQNDNAVNTCMTNGLIKTNMVTYETGVKGVYAGGDIVSGPKSVIEAVGTGRKAARSIDLYLGGDGIIESVEGLNKEYDMFTGRNEGFTSLQRTAPKFEDAGERTCNFEPYEYTYSEEEAIAESFRCLQCDLRLHLRHNPLPPEKFLKFVPELFDNVPQLEGVVQLYDDNKEVFAIKGSDNIKKSLLEMYESGKTASYFEYELDPMFTKRESELLQQFLQKHGKLPDSGDELDDLF